MNGHEKSDGCVVPLKPRTRPGDSQAAESVEGRRPVGGKASGDKRPGRRTGTGVSQQATSLRTGRPLRGNLLRLTHDRSPVRESRTPGSERGGRGNPVPYRDHTTSRLMSK